MNIWTNNYFLSCFSLHSTQKIKKRGPNNDMDRRTKYYTLSLHLFKAKV
jgi:hypothetical protein